MERKPGTYEHAINIGPRLRHDVERQIRELSNRFHPSAHDLRELEWLRSLLKAGANDV